MKLNIIAGPCVIENVKSVMVIAEKLKNICNKYNIPLIFKASYEKDNRSTIDGYRGPGIKDGLKILDKIKKGFNLPVLSDVHRESDVEEAGEIVDVIQIPAYLCQQTSLIVKAAKTGKTINVKKGQFISPYNMKGIIGKIESTGNRNIMLTERGSCFGYNQLIADMCSIPIMKKNGYPVVFDVTHCVRIYGIPSNDKNGGKPEFIENLACAAVAAGCDFLFIETHNDPKNALCDGASMLNLDLLPDLLEKVIPISEIIRKKRN